jgi:hypothetical protein
MAMFCYNILKKYVEVYKEGRTHMTKNHSTKEPVSTETLEIHH